MQFPGLVLFRRGDGEKDLRSRSAERHRERGFVRLRVSLLIFFWVTGLIPCFAYPNGQAAPEQTSERATDSMAQFEGLTVRRIALEGIAADRLTSLKGHLPQAQGAPLLRQDVAASLRALYATGLFESVEAAGQREGDGVALIFRGKARTVI